MKEGTVQISIEEHDRLSENDKILKQCYSYGYIEYYSNWNKVFEVKAIDSDESFELLSHETNRLKMLLEKKKWYQFVELKE